MELNDVQEQIIEEFEFFDDWMDRYNYLIELSRKLPIIAESGKNTQNLINGCQSRVWLDAKLVDGKIHFTADSDTTITKGIIALLIRILDNREPKEIIDADLYFIDKIGLKQNLSPTRSNGLVSMIKQMRMYALAYSTQQSKPQA
jgi:cysteine desulfuration protein SufE